MVMNGVTKFVMKVMVIVLMTVVASMGGVQGGVPACCSHDPECCQRSLKEVPKHWEIPHPKYVSSLIALYRQSAAFGYYLVIIGRESICQLSLSLLISPFVSKTLCFSLLYISRVCYIAWKKLVSVLRETPKCYLFEWNMGSCVNLSMFPAFYVTAIICFNNLVRIYD